MDANDIIAITGAFSGAVFGATAVFAAVSVAFDGARSNWLQRRAGVGGAVDRLLSKGIPAFNGPSSAILRIPPAQRMFERLTFALRVTGRVSDPASLCSLTCAACLALLLVGVAVGSALSGVAFAACLIAGMSAWANHTLELNRDAIREALPDAIRAMGSCFHAGFSLQQTFGQLGNELKGPVADLFSRANDAMETGSSSEEALNLIRSSQSVPELSFIAVALEVQHKAGGSMRHVLDAACESLEEELELRRSLKVQTAQARLSARVVTGVTIALVGLLSLLTDDFLAPFFSSALGFAMLVCAVVMQCAGVLIVRRMLKVEVD